MSISCRRNTHESTAKLVFVLLIYIYIYILLYLYIKHTCSKL